MSDAQTQSTSATELSARAIEFKDLIEDALNGAKQLPTGKSEVAEIIARLVDSAIDQGKKPLKAGLVKLLNEAKAELEKRISRQLAAVMHAPELLKLEGSWRGLHHMIKEAPDDPKIRFDVMNCTRKELSDDLTKAMNFDKSQLWRKIFEARIGKYAGTPMAAMICDFEFSHAPEDVAMLDALASIGKGSHSPVITAASAGMFKMDDFQELNKADRFTRIFESNKAEYAAWNTFRESPNSNFVALTVPRFLGRHVYGNQGVTKKADGLEGFNEFEYAADGSLEGVDQSQLCWSNAAYLAGANIVNAFYQFGIGVAIRGEKNGGLTGSLPNFVYKTKKGTQVMVGPAEVQNGTRADNELSELGFWSMAQLDQQDKCCFYGAQTVQKPKKFTDPDRSNDANICARLPYVLATGRLIHCLTRHAQTMIGSSKTDRQIEEELMDWAVSQFVSISATTEHEKRTKPFAEIKIEVASDPEDAGKKLLNFFLRPHLQIEQLHGSVHLVGKLPKAS
jgi:type VI secretion system protein ImpC